MVWNLFLALIPAALALALFRRGCRHGVAWCGGVVLWMLFLPNAPYVLTDVGHMVDDIKVAPTRTVAYLVLGTYACFFALGVSSYALSLHALRQHLRRVAPAWTVAPGLLVVHGLCVVGVYLGRVLRFNSWDALLAPARVIEAVAHVPRGSTVVLLLVTFLVVGVATYIAYAVGDRALSLARRLR
jgi:uncharacterized membrane protein